jgi:hypothetical protein
MDTKPSRTQFDGRGDRVCIPKETAWSSYNVFQSSKFCSGSPLRVNRLNMRPKYSSPLGLLRPSRLASFIVTGVRVALPAEISSVAVEILVYMAQGQQYQRRNPQENELSPTPPPKPQQQPSTPHIQLSPRARRSPLRVSKLPLQLPLFLSRFAKLGPKPPVALKVES